MNGNKYLLDTNIVLYIIGGKIEPSDIPKGKYSISFITELELLGYSGLSFEESRIIEEYLSSAVIFDINQQIKQKTILLRRKHKIKLPDAIICATAIWSGARLVTTDKALKSIESVIVL